MATPTQTNKVFNMMLPSDGPLVLAVALDFTTASTIEMDFTQAINNGTIDYISGMFIDNWDNDAILEIKVTGTYQRIICPANSQMYMPILAPNPPVFTCTFSGTPTIIRAQFYNIPLLPQIIQAPNSPGFNLPVGGQVGQVLGLTGIDPYVLGWFDLTPTPPTNGEWIWPNPTEDSFIAATGAGDTYIQYQP